MMNLLLKQSKQMNPQRVKEGKHMNGTILKMSLCEKERKDRMMKPVRSDEKEMMKMSLLDERRREKKMNQPEERKRTVWMKNLLEIKKEKK